MSFNYDDIIMGSRIWLNYNPKKKQATLFHTTKLCNHKKQKSAAHFSDKFLNQK